MKGINLVTLSNGSCKEFGSANEICISNNPLPLMYNNSCCPYLRGQIIH